MESHPGLGVRREKKLTDLPERNRETSSDVSFFAPLYALPQSLLRLIPCCDGTVYRYIVPRLFRGEQYRNEGSDIFCRRDALHVRKHGPCHTLGWPSHHFGGDPPATGLQRRSGRFVSRKS